MPSIYELFPPLLCVSAARIDNPVLAHPKYADDVKFFEDNPKRRLLIRRDAFEFDPEIPLGEWLQTPCLWLLVTQVAKGIHTVWPVYRGKEFWTIKDDESVAVVLGEFQRQEGINQAEFQAFHKRVTEKNMKVLFSNLPTDGNVH